MANDDTDNPAVGQPSSVPAAQEPETDDFENSTSTDAEEQPEQGQEEPQLTEEELEDLEYQGKKFKIPKEVKPLLMFQEDYTRKTMALAEERKAVHAQRQVEAQFTRAVGALTLMDEQIAQFDNTNWQELGNTDPVQAQNLRFQYEDLKTARDKLAYNIDQQSRERAAYAEQETANVRSQDFATLSKADPDLGWQGHYTQTLRDKLDPFARKFGYSGEQLSQVSSRDIKVLNLAMIGYETLQKQRKAASQPAVEAVPVPTLGKGKSAAPAGLDDRLSTEEWMKRRNAQVRRNAG